MEISKTFVLKTPVAEAWDFLTDPHRVVSCLPGAALTEERGDNTYAGTITVKVGPVSATYRGTMRFERLDPATRTAEMRAAGQDVRGKGGADMTMTSCLVERASGETEVTVVSNVNVMGMLAQFGRGMIQDVSDQMFDTFVRAMRAQLETPAAEAIAEAAGPSMAALWATARAARVPPAAPPPVDVIALGSTAIGRAIVRASRRRDVWLGAAALLALAIGYRLYRHRFV